MQKLKSVDEGQGLPGEGIARLAFLATVVLTGLTFWLAPRPPMSDLAQHAGQVTALHDLLLGRSSWRALLEINYFTPYLVPYALTLGLSFVMSAAAALKVVLTLGYWAFVACCVLLRARLGGDRRLDWLFVPGFLGLAYVWGFYTFLIALPVGVLFMVVAHRYAERPASMAGVVLLALDLVLFFSHGMVFAFANVVGVGFLLLQQRRLRTLAVALLPYVALFVVCVIYALVRLRFENESRVDFTGADWRWDVTRLQFFVYPFGAFRSAAIFAPVSLLMLAAPLVIGLRPNVRNAAAFVPFLTTLVVWLFVPFMFLHTAHIYQRFGVFLLPTYALMFGAARSIAMGPVRRFVAVFWLPALCWAFLAVHVERVISFARESASFEDVLAAAQPGHRALGLILDPASAASGNLVAYAHFPLWYQAEKGGLVDFNVAGTPAMVVRFKPGQAPPVSTANGWYARDFDWARDRGGSYRYFFVRHAAPLSETYFPSGKCRPVLLKSAGEWSLFENLNCYDPAAAGQTR